MTAVSKLHDQFRRFAEEQDERELDRYIDLCVVWRRKLTGEVIYKAGGKWDRLEKKWSELPATDGKIIDLTEAQYETAQKAAYWMQEFKAGRERDYFGLFTFGNRAAGKTYLASVIIVTLLIEFPYISNKSSIAWQVSSNHATRDELDRNIEDIFPSDWYVYREYPKHEFTFVNGATLTNISADDAESLKRGRVDFVLINEAQKLGQKAIRFGVARIKDRGGLAIFTSNPPETKKAEWIYHLWEEYNEATNKGEVFPIQFTNLDAKFNTHIDAHTSTQIDKILRIIDPVNSAADIEGIIRPVGSRAYWEFNKTVHIRSVPALPDITEDITRRMYGVKFPYIGGVDFQERPYIAGIIFKIYGTIQEPIFWAIDEIMVGPGQEDDFLDEVEENYNTKDILWIGDASGEYQAANHKNSRSSFAFFKARGWHIEPCRPKKNKASKASTNPPVEERVNLINKVLKKNQLYVDPSCKRLSIALKECQLGTSRYSGMKPIGKHAHATDAIGYATWYVIPPPKKKSSGIGGITAEMPKLQTW